MTTVSLLVLAEVVWVLSAAVWMILNRRSPTATLAWILALTLLPYVGVAVYLLIGPRRLYRKRHRHAAARAKVKHATPQPVGVAPQPNVPLADNEELRQFAALIERAGEGRPLRARRLDVIPSGDGAYDAIEAAIREARHHVHLEYYIWTAGRVGTRLRDLLCEKARQGVQVRLLLGGLGSAWLSRRFLRPLREAGAEVAWFNRLALARLRPGLINFRTHRKIVVCDGRVGFTGGVNICDDHSGRQRGPLAWRDTQVRLEGPPVGYLQSVFLEDWHFTTGGAPTHRVYFPWDQDDGDGPWVQVIASGPDDDLYPIHKFFFAAISGARRRVWLTTAYFVPDEAILTALGTAAMRGVDVCILVPSRSDVRLVDAAARSYFDDLLRMGVQVFLYGPPVVHAKTLVIDDDLAVVGTANMDNRSLRLNFEVITAVYDPGVAAEMAGQFAADLQNARPFLLRDARRVSLPRRFGESTARLLSPIL